MLASDWLRGGGEGCDVIGHVVQLPINPSISCLWSRDLILLLCKVGVAKMAAVAAAAAAVCLN